MQKKILIILALLICLSLPIFASAETILLKSGKTIEGKLIEKTNEYIKIDFQGVVLTYFFDEIESVDGQKYSVVSPKTDSVAEPKVNVISQDSEQLNILPENIEQDDIKVVTSVADAPLKKTPQQAKPALRQTKKYVTQPKDQASKALLPMGATVGILGTFLVFIMVILLISYIYTSICLQLIAKKTAQEPSWLAWVPIANLFLSCKIAGLSYLWLFIMFAALIPVIGSFCIAAFSGYLWYRIAVALNKPGWLGALIIIPVVNFVIMGYLAFSKD